MQTIVTLLCRRLKTIRRNSLVIVLILGILSFDNFAAWAQGTFVNYCNYCGACNFCTDDHQYFDHRTVVDNS